MRMNLEKKEETKAQSQRYEESDCILGRFGVSHRLAYRDARPEHAYTRRTPILNHQPTGSLDYL